jgi:hypothetical protein
MSLPQVNTQASRPPVDGEVTRPLVDPEVARPLVDGEVKPFVDPEVTRPPVNPESDRRCADLTRRAEAYAVLSRSYSAGGDVRLAVLATWAADVQMLESLLWESGLASAPDPEQQLRSVAEAIVDSLTSSLAAPPGTPRSLVEEARTAMTAAFDVSVHALLAERFTPLDHLDHAEFSTAAPPGSAATRLHARTVTELIADLRVTAADCIAVARVMSAAGRMKDAWQHLRLSDTAVLEAYLLDAAVTSGDTRLASVDLRWDLAVSVLAELPDHPEDLGRAVVQCRDRLAGTVGLAERGPLLAAFEQWIPAPG